MLMMLCFLLSLYFLISQDNPSEKDINQGILVVSNLDSSVSNDELHKIFGFYGEVKQVSGSFFTLVSVSIIPGMIDFSILIAIICS